MSNAKLVGVLKDCRRALIETFDFVEEGRIVSTIDDAITALSSQDAVRDRALEEAARIVTDRCADIDGDTAQDRTVRMELNAAAQDIRAMKSKPTTEERRTGEVDRRKSRFGNSDVANSRDDATCRDQFMYGRRKDDRARWTQPPAPECDHTWVYNRSIGRAACEKCGADYGNTIQLQNPPSGMAAWLRSNMSHPSDTVMFSDLEDFAAELDTRLGGKNV